MKANDLDTVYTKLAQTIQDVRETGSSASELLLSILALSLLARMDDADAALDLIAQAEKLTIEK